MFYFVSCLLGFSIVLGVGVSLFVYSPKSFFSEGEVRDSSKANLFETYLKTEDLFNKGLILESEWEIKKQSFLDDYERLKS